MDRVESVVLGDSDMHRSQKDHKNRRRKKKE